MNLLDFVNDLPEDKRESFRAMAQNALVIANREDAAKYIAEHPHLKSERDAIISRTTDNYAVRFKEEKLPGIMADELKKLNPPKDAKDQAIEEARNEAKALRREWMLEKRTAEATKRLSELGLPISLAKYAVDEDENIFSSKIEELSGLNAWKEAEIKKALTGAVGNQATPKGGQVGAIDFNTMSQTAIMQFASRGQPEKEAVTQWLATKK